MDDVLAQLPSFGVAGLLFVMWWFERKERTRSANALQAASRDASAKSEVSERLLDVIQANTEAVTALREELRSYRQSQHDWLDRISRQLETVEFG